MIIYISYIIDDYIYFMLDWCWYIFYTLLMVIFTLYITGVNIYFIYDWCLYLFYILLVIKFILYINDTINILYAKETCEREIKAR